MRRRYIGGAYGAALRPDRAGTDGGVSTLLDRESIDKPSQANKLPTRHRRICPNMHAYHQRLWQRPQVGHRQLLARKAQVRSAAPRRMRHQTFLRSRTSCCLIASRFLQMRLRSNCRHSSCAECTRIHPFWHTFFTKLGFRSFCPTRHRKDSLMAASRPCLPNRLLSCSFSRPHHVPAGRAPDFT